MTVPFVEMRWFLSYLKTKLFSMKESGFNDLLFFLRHYNKRYNKHCDYTCIVGGDYMAFGVCIQRSSCIRRGSALVCRITKDLEEKVMRIGVNFLAVLLLFAAVISVGYLKGRYINPVDPNVNECLNKSNQEEDQSNG